MFRQQHRLLTIQTFDKLRHEQPPHRIQKSYHQLGKNAGVFTHPPDFPDLRCGCAKDRFQRLPQTVFFAEVTNPWQNPIPF